MLFLQKIKGTKFFLPPCLKNEYDYIKKFEKNANNSLSTFVDVDTEEILCPICLTNIHYDDLQKPLQEYMLTPCHHKFHVKCLLTWIELKFECPQCRAALPKIEL